MEHRYELTYTLKEGSIHVYADGVDVVVERSFGSGSLEFRLNAADAMLLGQFVLRTATAVSRGGSDAGRAGPPMKAPVAGDGVGAASVDVAERPRKEPGAPSKEAVGPKAAESCGKEPENPLEDAAGRSQPVRIRAKATGKASSAGKTASDGLAKKPAKRTTAKKTKISSADEGA